MFGGNNMSVPMTRRFPNLPQKVLRRDAAIVQKLITAWDVEKDAPKMLSIFVKEQKNLSDERYWELLRSVWIICGGVDNVQIFRTLFKSARKERHYFSTPEEATFLRNLPDNFDVYRATNDAGDNGISWTLHKEYALWYAEAYEKKQVLSKTALKKEVFAYIERNLEAEILIL